MVSSLLYSTVKVSIYVYKITSTVSASPEDFIDVLKKQLVFRKLGLGSHEAYLGPSQTLLQEFYWEARALRKKRKKMPRISASCMCTIEGVLAFYDT